MKTALTPLLLKTAAAATLTFGLVFSSACSKTRDTTDTTSSTSSAATGSGSTTASTTAPATTTTGDVAAATGTTASGATDTWDSLKDYSYDRRAEFTQKVTSYANNLDNSLSVAKGNAGARITEARDELRTAASELSNATADTWDATKDRVGRAMQKADSAIRGAAE